VGVGVGVGVGVSVARRRRIRGLRRDAKEELTAGLQVEVDRLKVLDGHLRLGQDLARVGQ